MCQWYFSEKTCSSKQVHSFLENHCLKNQANLLDPPRIASRMHPALASIFAIRQEYIKNRYAFIPGRIMQKLLQFIGASSDDLKRLEYSGNNLHEDPTLAFRKSRNGRFLIDFKETKIKG